MNGGEIRLSLVHSSGCARVCLKLRIKLKPRIIFSHDQVKFPARKINKSPAFRVKKKIRESVTNLTLTLLKT